MAALNGYAEGLRTDGRGVPWFDPHDGGAAAQCLILLERPARLGETPRFVSCDNPVPAQRNLRRFLAEAGLTRRRIVIWNAVPWLPPADAVRNAAPRAAEIREGLTRLPALLKLLPALQVVVLAGRVPGRAASLCTVPVVQVPHPSPVNVNANPSARGRIVAGLSQAASKTECPTTGRH
ncbi:uracil DNA glycosylase superfamily protein [Palleronia aestuarii]|uniref:Uracil DNA glycosylase superfamily protein n=1 Tax=Palleronia aestuarii TaxID=568105 RepID=A0A2W7PXF0_9RHOB|nr:uracil-DNA glycosylase [Palleronia aestuarii]PZX14209.1 uracil DNA glycosylase superfamily protein [Palleronia aestuarii]